MAEGEAVEDAKGSNSLARLRAALSSGPDSSDQPDLDTRLADVVVAWNVFRHFYPYWTEAGVDWDARLRPQLELAYEATTRAAHRDALRLLVADRVTVMGLLSIHAAVATEARCRFSSA